MLYILYGVQLLPLMKEEVMFLGESVCFTVCLSVGYFESSECILWNFLRGSDGPRTKWLDFLVAIRIQ